MITFSREKFLDIYPEMEPLTSKHHKEIAWNVEKVPLDVDVEKYQNLEEAGALVVFGLRYRGILIGYSAFILHEHLHYKSTKFASNDVVFIESEFRRQKIGMEFIQFCEDELKSLGCQVVALRIKDCLDWSPLAKHLGYESVESTHLKWIGD